MYLICKVLAIFNITVSATVRELNISFNNIGDDGISVIIEVLQYENVLTELKVKECGLSMKGIIYYNTQLIISIWSAICYTHT